MSEVLAILGGSSTLTLAVLIVLVARWGMKAKDGEAAARAKTADAVVAHGETKADLAATRFELVATAKALAAANTRADALAEELSNAIAARSLGDGLAADDVNGRLLRLAAEAEAARGEVPAEPGAVLSDAKPAATGETIAAAVRNLGIIDELR